MYEVNRCANHGWWCFGYVGALNYTGVCEVQSGLSSERLGTSNSVGRERAAILHLARVVFRIRN